MFFNKRPLSVSSNFRSLIFSVQFAIIDSLTLLIFFAENFFREVYIEVLHLRSGREIYRGLSNLHSMWDCSLQKHQIREQIPVTETYKWGLGEEKVTLPIPLPQVLCTWCHQALVVQKLNNTPQVSYDYGEIDHGKKYPC